ncbi:disease resistance protein RPV1-like [Mangifera indica]|uniref:disease resistance protein RPV1-like n=1 Tax=Mangifera indica TaxID=29780 RepID=UPI001CF96E5C|nr:disease resistance protein RPV1-like [Mangifera indica]
MQNEASLVINIVDGFLKRLDYDSSVFYTKNLVGLDSSIEKTENLLCTEGVRTVGIWGIGGIGKTTLAKAIFNKISRQFEAFYFIENIREESEKSGGLNGMHQKLSHALLGDIHPNIGFIFPRERLNRKKVLIVFDDGSTTIRSIRLDMTKVGELHLNPKTFNNMRNLRFLEFYGFEPEEKVTKSDSSVLRLNLRFLKNNSSNDAKKVHGFEVLKYDFGELSKVEKLWTGNQKLVNLKHIDLSHAKHLCRMPNFSLIPNLESLILKGCTKLKSFSSIHNLYKLVILNLQGCKGLKIFSISVHWRSLRHIYLSDCSNLKTVSYLPCTVEILYLDGTAIKELLSIEHLLRLEVLYLRNCSRLEKLPESIRELKSLIRLNLSGCTKLDRLPNDIENLTGLWRLDMMEVALAEIPNNIGQLLSLKHLFLDQNNFERLPVSIKNLSKLEWLSLNNCQRLKSLPELPVNFVCLEANNCTSLESISSLPASFLSFRRFWETIGFINCSKINLDLADNLHFIKRKLDVWGRSKISKEQRCLLGQVLTYAMLEVKFQTGLTLK